MQLQEEKQAMQKDQENIAQALEERNQRLARE